MPIKPAGADHRLIESFRRAIEGRGDGRVSEADVRDHLLPRLVDGGGRLSQRERDTLEWALGEFNMTDAAKRLLSDEITRLAGAPVFEWQRELAGPVGVQLDGRLPQPQLDRKAGEAFLANAQRSSASDEDAMYWYPESGNSGTHLSEHTGAAAERYLKFLAAVLNMPSLLTECSAETHAVYGVYQSGDEEHFGGILVDKKTGKATALEPYNIVDLTYDLDRPTFESIFGEVKGDDGRRAPDDEWEDVMWSGDFMNDNLHGQRHVDIPNFSKAQRERRANTLSTDSGDLREKLRNATSGRKAIYDWGALTRTSDVEQALKDAVEVLQVASFRDEEKPSSSPTVIQPPRPLDAAAREAILAVARAVEPSVTAAELDKLLAGLGNASDLRYAEVELPMIVKERDGATHDVTTRAHMLVNVAEGDWFGIYEREKLANDW